MRFSSGILSLFLILGFLLVPNCVFAQETESRSSDYITESSIPAMIADNHLNPAIKGGGGGSRGGSSSGSSSSSYKKIKLDDGDDDAATGDGDSWWVWIIVAIIAIIIIIAILWYLKR